MRGRNGEFNFSFQVKIIAMLLRDAEFLKDFGPFIEPAYFSTPAHQVIFGKVRTLIENFDRIPSLEAVLEELEQVEDPETQKLALMAFGDALDTSLEDADYYNKRAFDFIKHQNMTRTLLKSVQLVRDGKIDDVAAYVEKETLAVNQIAISDVGVNYWNDVGKNDVVIEIEKIPTLLGAPGSGGLDDSIKGGLGKGEYGLVMMPTGSGKSIFLVNVGGNAMLQGFNVVFISLEMSELEIRNRFNIYFSGLPYEKMKVMPPQRLKSRIIKNYENLQLGNLLIKSFPMSSITVPQIEAFIRSAEKKLGWKADLVCIDYLETIKPTSRAKDDHERQGATSQELKGLSQKLPAGLWVPTQVRRTHFDRKIIVNEDASGSYAKTFPADIVLAMKPEFNKELGKKFGKMNLAKVRNSMSHRVLNFELDFEVMRYIYMGEVDFEEDHSSTAKIKDFFDERKQRQLR